MYDTADGGRIEYTRWGGRYQTTTHERGHAKTTKHISQEEAWNATKEYISEHGGLAE